MVIGVEAQPFVRDEMDRDAVGVEQVVREVQGRDLGWFGAGARLLGQVAVERLDFAGHLDAGDDDEVGAEQVDERLMVLGKHADEPRRAWPGLRNTASGWCIACSAAAASIWSRAEAGKADRLPETIQPSPVRTSRPTRIMPFLNGLNARRPRLDRVR